MSYQLEEQQFQVISDMKDVILAMKHVDVGMRK